MWACPAVGTRRWGEVGAPGSGRAAVGARGATIRHAGAGREPIWPAATSDSQITAIYRPTRPDVGMSRGGGGRWGRPGRVGRPWGHQEPPPGVMGPVGDQSGPRPRRIPKPRLFIDRPVRMWACPAVGTRRGHVGVLAPCRGASVPVSPPPCGDRPPVCFCGPPQQMHSAPPASQRAYAD